MNSSLLKRCKVISFDLFDTVVTRRYFRPEHLFIDLEKMLVLENVEFRNLAAIRKESEFEVRRRGNFQVETDLEEIYREVGERLQLSPGQRLLCMEKELELEERAAAVNGRAAVLIRELRQRGKKIIFVSDTYLPPPFIERLLAHLGLLVAGDGLYISSATGKMKANGEMFHHILNDLDISPDRLCHIGDNRQSDVEMPGRLGIRALHYNEVFASRYETFSGDNVLLSRLVSMSKITRLRRSYPDERRRTIWDVTADVAAPLIFFFVYWSIVEAVEKNIRRLYFLARDGQIMSRLAARIIGEHFPGDVEARYLQVSRQALLFPALRELDDEAFEWIMAPTALLTPRIILKRINIDPAEIRPLLARHGFHRGLDRHLPHARRGAFRNLLREAESLIMARAGEYRRNALDYLGREGLLDDDLYAVVDIGWSGTLQRSISRMLDMAGRRAPVHGFYFGLRNRKKHREQDQLFAWFTDSSFTRDLDRTTYIVPMTELFTAADHGGVRKYARRGARVEPVLGSAINARGMKWGVGLQQEGMLEYAEEALQLGKEGLIRIAREYRGWFERTYARLLTDPTMAEARVYGSYPDAEDQNESYFKPLARGYSLLDLYRLRRNRRYQHHHNEWRAAVVRLTRPRLRKLLDLKEPEAADPDRLPLREERYFYLISFPRSGNTWVVNSLRDYLGAQRAEIMPSVYGGELLEIGEGIQVKVAGCFDPSLPVGIKTHMNRGRFVDLNLPANKIVYLLRDVRDVMTSYYFYLYGFLGKDVDKAKNFSPAHFTEHLRRETPNYRKHLAGWLRAHKGAVLPVRYEELKGDYIAALRKIRDFLGLAERLPVEEVKRRYVDDFRRIDNFDRVLQGRNTDFYRKGVVGDWKNYFTAEHVAIVKQEAGELLVELGYERDLDW